jgi:thioredoxin-related protein
MAREVYTDKEFIKFSKSLLFMRVFEDTSAEGKSLARKFRIEGTPTLIILDSSGKEIDRILGGMDARDLIEELKEIIQSAKSEKYTI